MLRAGDSSRSGLARLVSFSRFLETEKYHLNFGFGRSRFKLSIMKPARLLRFCLLICACLVSTQAFAQITNRVLYSLLEGSYLVDDCLICGRPTIMQPLRGTFELVPEQITPPYSRYAVKNIAFVASPGSWLERRVSGTGTYIRFEEFAILQDMNLALQIKDNYTNRPAWFTNESRNVSRPFPLIQVDLKQTNGTLIQTFSLQLFAAPVREIWFSTTRSLTSTNRSAPSNQISAGDLLSNHGRVVKRNRDLVGRLGVMPIVSDLGLDAVHVSRRGEILFSLPAKVFSETLGYLQHGDVLSSRGAIVKRNQQLLAAFHPPTTTDAGLDAVQILPDGEILFSIQSNLTVSSSLTLSRGDILSDRGRVFLTHQQLMANFQPSVTNRDFGLDALHIFPSGEIWFSVEEGFTDNRIGVVRAGDLLSNLGYRVFKNEDLVADFAPADPSLDYGLDALFVVSDIHPPRPAPRITRPTRDSGAMRLEWDGEGSVFQVEYAADLAGPWSPCSPIVPDLSCEADCNPAAGAFGYYRLRQW